MAVVCPICKSSAQELPAGEATAFHCPTHGDFKVAETVFAEAKVKGKGLHPRPMGGPIQALASFNRLAQRHLSCRDDAMIANRPMTAEQAATHKRKTEAAYERDAYKPNLTSVEADLRIAMLTAKLKLLDAPPHTL